ncbi:MAG: glycosyltransferase [Selenomonadaceae bacterium]|nr:glycosyltransferase [Selenomonadaceae bacterium]
MELPAISVIIPMYNVEKYIGECLDSLLNQTFQNFEVVVVDDCSTDNSVAIAESYKPKFGGRMKIASMEENSGFGGFPRNRGIELAHGEYISFLDSDDTFTPTAFEELYPIAKDFDADVVVCEKYYQIPDKFWHNAKARAKIQPVSYKKGEFVDRPTLLENDLEKRTVKLVQRFFMWNIWSRLFKRDFIIENVIKMPSIPGEDAVFTICTLSIAQRCVVVPNVINYYRIRENSVSTEKMDVEKNIRKWLRALILGFEYIDAFLSKRKIFSERRDLKYMLLNLFAQEMFIYFSDVYTQLPAYALYEILRDEFDKHDTPALTPFIFSAMNVYRLKASQDIQRIAELEKTEREDKAYIAELEKAVTQLLNKE